MTADRRTTDRPHQPASVARSRAGLSAALGVLLAVVALAACPGSAHAVRMGIVDWRLENGGLDLATLPALTAELGPAGLNAKWTRVLVRWTRLQPEAPGTSTDADGYADEYVSELDQTIGALEAQGMNVILTTTDVPEWASDESYWTNGYDNDVVMRLDDDVRAQFRALAAFLVTRYYGERCRWFEVWNEPNLNSGIDPQWVDGQPIGPKAYLTMLQDFWSGVRSVSTDAVVIAGATAPRGANDGHSTTPQTFAAYLKSHGASKWFNAYSHHPYTPRGTRLAAPDQPPNNPRRCVTLGNLPVLLKLFPKKPFYLTEFAYGTKYSELCGLKVSRTDQARYLRQAATRVKMWPQVKALLWYSVLDFVPDPQQPTKALYLGLVEADGVTRKPSWYAFAGGNRLAISGPSSIELGDTAAIAGTLTTKLGAGAGTKVLLQSRAVGGRSWSNRKSAITLADGSFSFSVKPLRSVVLRVAWDGVCSSRSLKVVVNR